MKAMVYHGANDIRFEEKPRPQIIDPTDAVVKIVKTTICGTDLGIWKGKNPEVADGRILGHEGIGIVEEVGDAVKTSKSVIKSLFHASANAVLATTAKSNSIHTAVTAAGFWAT